MSCGLDAQMIADPGGQYLFVVPSLDLVAVITAGNFRTGKTRQPEEILRRFVLPAVLRPPDSQ